MLEMRAQAAILSHCRPTILQYPYSVAPRVDHGLDRQHHALAQPHPTSPLTEIRDLGILVHVSADAVAHKLLHHAEAFGLHHLLHRRTDIAQHRAGTDRVDGLFQRRLGYIQQPLRLRRHLAHRDGDGRAAIEAIDDHSAIHRENVAIAQHRLRRRDAMHHLLVQRGAEHAGKPVIALESRLGARILDQLRRDVLEIKRGHAWLHHGPDGMKHLAHNPAGAAHLLHFLPGFDHDRHDWFPFQLGPQVVRSQVLYCRQNTARHHVYRRIAIDLSKAAQIAVVFEYRRRLLGIGAHALGKDRLGVVHTLLEHRLIEIADRIGGWRFQVHVIDALAYRTASPAGDAQQQLLLIHLQTDRHYRQAVTA